ncbi:MAG: DUF418 domain-containing protein [Chloroflexota bacterium]
MTISPNQAGKVKTTTGTRIIGYDFARALAILGMFIVNFKIVMNASDVGSDWFTGLIGLLEGRAAATFVVLAGVGIALFSARARKSDVPSDRRHAQKLLVKRAIFLFVFGLLYTPIWPADILHFYGLYITFAALVLFASERQLLIWAGGFVAIFVLLLFLMDYEAGWDWTALEYTDFWTPAGLVRHMFFNGWHPVFPWTAFVLLGMWLGRQDIRNAKLQKRLLVTSLIALTIAELSSMMLTMTFEPALGSDIASALFSRDMIPPMPLYMLSASATAVIVIVLSVMYTEHFQDKYWLQPFVSTGQLALTLYVAHVLVGMGIIEALGWFEGQSLAVSVRYSILFYIGAVVFSHVWRQYFKRGPVEWIMRQVTG